MELLALEGKIKEKIYGKQKIYFADQVCLRNVLLGEAAPAVPYECLPGEQSFPKGSVPGREGC